MSSARRVRFDRSDDRIRVDDRVTGEVYDIGVPSAAGPLRSVEQTDAFPVPLDRTVAVETDRIDFPAEIFWAVRAPDGTVIDGTHGVGSDETLSGSAGGFLDLSSPVKTYIRFDAPFTVYSDEDALRVETDRRATVVIGARAWHRYPESTITIRPEVDDLLDAVSRFGSALRTVSPERTYPTLRGHPPAIRLGDGYACPAELDAPSTDIELVVEPTLANICAVAPLAYYLPATLTPGDRFAVRCGEREYVPPETEVFEAATAILRHCFTLDCLGRSEGIYPTVVDERREFDRSADVDLDFAALYEASPAERTARYLSVPREAVRPYVPPWPTTAVFAPEINLVDALPGFVAQLAAVRVADPPRYTGTEARKQVLKSFVNDQGATRDLNSAGTLQESFVDVPETDSRRTVWVGEGVPLNGVAFRLAGRHNRYDRASTEQDATGTSVIVVCNDASMAGESEGLPAMLESRPDLEVEYTLERRTTTTRLREIVEQGTDYLHFIGHATPDGLECIDGRLDLGDVDQSRVRLFCLNACRSFEQGAALVDRGSVGGLVTVTDVADRFASEVGSDIVTLLDRGHPLGSINRLLRDYTAIGRQYITVGDPYASLSETTETMPGVAHIETVADRAQAWQLAVACGGASPAKLGSFESQQDDWRDSYSICLSRSDTIEIDLSEIPAFATDRDLPVVVDGELFADPTRLESELDAAPTE